MMRSLFAAVSGLKVHQQRMDVIGNNIANVNTPGFKKSRVTFQDMFYQMLRGASRPVSGGRGGTNPVQVGPGVVLGSIDTIMTAASLQETGKMTDLGISGEGFFILGAGDRKFYTRVGNFDFDSQGNLVSLLNGMRVYGWMKKDAQGAFITDEANLEPIAVNFNETEPAKRTENVFFAGNLDARTEQGGSRSVRLTVYDSLGKTYSLELKFTHTQVRTDTQPDQWEVYWKKEDGTEQSLGKLEFDSSGKLTGPQKLEISNFPNVGKINLDFSNVTQYASSFTVEARSQDGYAAGVLENLSIDTTGTIVGVFSNGVTRPLAQIALKRFTNPAGLVREGESLFSDSPNAGALAPKPPGTSGYGTVKPGSLEMSNVDLSSEFTEMIITQRGFQANSRVITATDEMLQELVNLKR